MTMPANSPRRDCAKAVALALATASCGRDALCADAPWRWLDDTDIEASGSDDLHDALPPSASSEISRRRLDDFALRPRILRTVGPPKMRTLLFGRLRFPVFVGVETELLHPRIARALRDGAHQAGVTVLRPGPEPMDHPLDLQVEPVASGASRTTGLIGPLSSMPEVHDAVKRGASGVLIAGRAQLAIADLILASRTAFPHLPIVAAGEWLAGAECLLALAMGASAVSIARPMALAAAAAGAEGAWQAAFLYLQGIRRAMGLCGVPSLDAIGPALYTASERRLAGQPS